MNIKRLKIIFGGVVFIFATGTYLYTMQPNLSFWDCGEFVACAYTLSVPHPPGAPLWTTLGKVATLLPFGSNPAAKMNALAAISSGFSVLFLFLVCVSVIQSWKGKIKTNLDAVFIFTASAIGALSFAFCDSVWFNANESEVYALGQMLVSLCTWLLMFWWERADNKGSERILLLIAFIIGLSLGIHLLVVQIILVGGLVVAFRVLKNLDSEFVMKYLIVTIPLTLVLIILYALKMDTVYLGGLAITIFGGQLYYLYKKDYTKYLFALTIDLTAISFLLVYPIITIYLPKWLSGNVSFWLAIILLVGIVYGIYWAITNKRANWAFGLSAIFLVLLGYSIYTGVVLRARVDNLPINENEPKNFESLVKYLSREQYGEAPFLPRRYSQEPMHRKTWVSYTSDLDFLWRYQINHMFNRYLGWQFIGRDSYDQDKGISWSKFYGIPFLIGLFGLFYHFRKDWKLGFIFLWMFLLMGIFTALFQRQQDPQPRERDYFYTGAFFVFSLWIGIGIMGIIELIYEGIKNSSAAKLLSGGVLVAAFVLIPLNMFRVNAHYNNRHDNIVPFEYAYNILQSVDKDAIVFTNGDNDTFPLWYLQSVGYRQDVRIVNLSLLNTDWYAKEMKNSMPYGAMKVPISMNDQQLERLSPIEWGEFKTVTINVPPEAYPDSLKSKGQTPDKLTWRMPSSFTQGNVKGVKVADQLTYDIIKTNNWQRPVYFSATVTEDNYIGLDEYVVLEGMAKRIVPFKGNPMEQVRVDKKRMWDNWMVQPAAYSKTPQSGFYFTGFNNPKIFFDQVQENIVQNYRSVYMSYAYAYLETDKQKTAEILNKMEEYMPLKVVESDYRIAYDIGMIYARIGDMNKFNEYAAEVEPKALAELKRNPNDVQSYWNPYKILVDIYETRGDYQKAIEILQQLERMQPNSPELKAKIELLRTKIQGK